MRITNCFESRTARAVFTAGVTAVSAMTVSSHVSAGEMRVLAASREVEVALPGVGPRFVSALPETSLTEGSEVRTGKGGWAILRLGNETQVELRADSEVIFSAATPAGATPAIVEVELRRGALGALADGGTELRVRFASGVAVGIHARFAVLAERNDPARVIVERGIARVAASGGKEQAAPTAGQFVEIDQFTAGHTMTAVQPVRSNDADAVSEMAALRFVPATVDPATKPPLTVTDNSALNRPITMAPMPPITAVADSSSANSPVTTVMPPPPLATENSSTNPPSTVPTSALPSVPPVGHDAAPLGSFVDVDPLQALANGANITGPVNSPEHP